MKRFLKDKRRLVFVGTFLAISFLAVSVMAAKITPEDKLRKAEELSIKASEMATKAKVSYNVGLAKKALELANQATYLVLEVVTEAQKKNDPALAQASIHTANSVMKTITQIIAAATFISQISEDPKTIADVKEILEKANKAKEMNNKAIQVARTSKVMTQGDRIRFNNLKVIPGITLQEVYDDNIYLGNGANNTIELKESDLITHIMPSLGLDYSLHERGNVSFDYTGDLAYYNDNNSNDWQTHKGEFNFNYQAPGGIILDINTIHIDAEDPYGNPELYRIGLKTERRGNDLKAKIAYSFGNRFQILAYYNYYKQDYDLLRDYTQDWDVTEFGAGFQMRLLPKTWAFFRYYFGERDYFTHPAGTGVNGANDSDFGWNRVNFGLTWDIGAKLGGELNFGYQMMDYENAADVEGDRYDGKNTWIAATSITYTATPTIGLALSLTRALRETGSSDNEYFEDTGIGINIKKVIKSKFILTVGGFYAENNYNIPLSKPREDHNYGGNIGLVYQVQDWLTAGIDYMIKQKNSIDYGSNDYTDSQFMISLSSVF